MYYQDLLILLVLLIVVFVLIVVVIRLRQVLLIVQLGQECVGTTAVQEVCRMLKETHKRKHNNVSVFLACSHNRWLTTKKYNES